MVLVALFYILFFEATCLPVFIEPRVSEVVLGRQWHHVLVKARQVLRLQLDRDGAFRHLLQRLDQLLLLAPAVAGDPVERDLHALAGVQQTPAKTIQSHDDTFFFRLPAFVFSNLLSVFSLARYFCNHVAALLWQKRFSPKENLFASRPIMWHTCVFGKYASWLLICSGGVSCISPSAGASQNKNIFCVLLAN